MKLVKFFLLFTLFLMCFSNIAMAELGFNYLERSSYSILTDWHDHEYTLIEGLSSGASGLFHQDLSSTRFGVEAHSYHHSLIENTDGVLAINGNFNAQIVYPFSYVISPYPQTRNAITLIFSCTNPVNYTLEVQSAGYQTKNLEIFRIDGGNESFEDIQLTSGEYTSSGHLPGPGVYQIKVEYDIAILPGDFMTETGSMDFVFVATEEGTVATESQSWNQVKTLFR